MRKILLFAFAVQFFMPAASAQNWCKPGATWHHSIYHIGPIIGAPANWTNLNGVVKYQYTGDTLINAISCNIVNSTFSGKYNSSMPAATTITNF